jgi:hypothetical protein
MPVNIGKFEVRSKKEEDEKSKIEEISEVGEIGKKYEV